MIRPLLWCLLGLLWPPLLVASMVGEPLFQTVSGTDETANGIITAIAQDRRGLIWYGSTEGLFHFDGYQLRRYRHQPGDPNSLGDDYVRALLARPDGTLWVATQSGGISVYHPDRDAFDVLQPQEGNPNSLAHVGVVSLAADPDGSVWIGYGVRGLDRYDPSSGEFQRFRADHDDPTALSHDTVRSLLVDRRGDLWAGTSDGLNRLRRGQSSFERIAPGSKLDNQYVYSLFQASDGRIWIGTQSEGAAVLQPETLELQFLPLGEAGISHPWVDGFVEPRPGRIWIASFGGGLDVYDSLTLQKVRRIRSDPSIPGSLAMDRIVQPMRATSGLIWIGTWGGGLQWHNPRNADAFRMVRYSPMRPDGLSNSSAMSLMELESGHIWVGTDGGGIDELDLERGVVRNWNTRNAASVGLGDDTIRALARTADGSRWVGTQQAGLLRFDPTRQTFRRVAVGAQDRRISHLLASQAGGLWVAAQRGLAWLDSASEAVEMLNLEDGRPFSDSVWALREDAEGRLWIGTAGASYVCLPGERVMRALSAGAPEAVMDFWLPASGEIWTIGPAGIHRAAHRHQETLRFAPWGKQLQPTDPSFGRQFLPDEQGRLWTPNHLLQPDPAQAIEIGRADGVDVGNVDIGARLKTREGILLFGGTRGLLVIRPELYQPWQFRAPILVTSLEINGQKQSLAQMEAGLSVPFGRRIAVEFALLDYSSPNRHHYAYRLFGVDDEWINTDSSRRLASYTRLWPGTYELQLRGMGRNGEWSDVYSLPLRVLPAWWQTNWFIALSLVLLGLATYALIHWRTLRLRQAQVTLQQLVAERTAELSTAKQHAERALEELRGAQSQLVVAEKMASLGQLVAGVAHEINTPIGIAVTAASHLLEENRSSQAKLDSNTLTRGDLKRWRETVDEAGRLVLSSLERANVLITSFKQVSVDQTSEHRRRFDLATFLGEVKTSLLPSFRRSTHRLEIDCPSGLELDTYPGALFQIMMNLVNNAVVHAFEPDQAGIMRIRAELRGERVILVFSDNGKGMEAATATRAFDPFFTTRRGRGGSGLGLHVVYNLTTQLLGGKLDMHTVPGQGTEFVFELPRVAGTPLSEN
nr:sensor histidine kinase [Pseudomarimonas arenosa]